MAFQQTKEALCNSTNLVHPVGGAQIALTTDASDVGIGAVLEQRVKGKWQPLAFYSKVFSAAESRYSAFDRELLAVYAAIRHFKYFLEGRDFAVYTDHKPLLAALAKPTEPRSARQTRHLSAIAEFTSNINHVAGKNNLVVDALSRVRR